PMDITLRETGSESMIVRVRTCVRDACSTSTCGDCPDTVSDSSSVPTFISAFTVTTVSDGTSTPVRVSVVKPESENVNLYGPGRRLSMRYRPWSSVETARTPSISTGLAASTVTPGSTPPDSSLTTPAIEACARTTLGASSTQRNTTAHGMLPGSCCRM